MCGIVAYFGHAGNGITRILTGMSSIYYRAPDSTGVGLFGAELEPIRVRKALGTVSNLSRALLNASVYPNQSEKLKSLWIVAKDDAATFRRQLNILRFEEHSTEVAHEILSGKRSYVSYRQLIDPELSYSLTPGWPGRPDPLPPIYIRSEEELKKVVNDLIVQYDLSLTVFHSHMVESLSETLENYRKKNALINPPADILTEFDRLIENVFHEETIKKPAKIQFRWPRNDPDVLNELWKLLQTTPVHIPEDYDTDGVRGVFRLLDAALLSRTRLNPGIHVDLQQILENLWPKARKIPNTDWHMLYWAEKGANVYGWAAAAVMTYLQKMELFPILWDAAKKETSYPRTFVSGHTDSHSLSYFATPLIGHGRWAMQSAVTLKNAHPFLDAYGSRAVVLNGHFSGEVENQAKKFLSNVAQTGFRSDNSTEYFALLWGYYFDNLKTEKKRYDEIRSQLAGDLEDYNIGSMTIDYNSFNRIQGKTVQELDELAFLTAVRRMARYGGQIAVAGISLYSPRRLYVASHNRPVFIVRSHYNDDFMVVSDINAAMGLFPQYLIREKILELKELNTQIKRNPPNPKTRNPNQSSPNNQHKLREKKILESFMVDIFPLEGKEKFALIETGFEKGKLMREIVITDFEGNPLPEIEKTSTMLNPLQVRKDPYESFFEMHLHEIPGRIEQILNIHLEDEIPSFFLHERTLQKRFGNNLSAINRIVLAGMGSSYHAGLLIKSFFHELMPDLDVLVIQPVEIDDISSTLVPENDLVLLLSWSGTTADMVEFAKELYSLNILCVAFTEKIFADMAWICDKSGGVIPVHSGEEITVSALKSSLCLLFCLALFALWLTDKLTKQNGTQDYLSQLKELPNLLEELLHQPEIDHFNEKIVSRSVRSHACIVVGDLHTRGTCREAALKLEENSGSAIGKPMDYRDFTLTGLKHDLNENLIIVIATNEKRLGEAISVMKQLNSADIPFAAVSYVHPQHWEIDLYSRGNYVYLPKIDDSLQPFVDLLFFYKFTMRYARARGRHPDDMPRNRAKSVTAGRSRPLSGSIPALKIQHIEKLARKMAEIPLSGETAHEERTRWEKIAKYDWELNNYRTVKKIVRMMDEPYPLFSLTEPLPEKGSREGAGFIKRFADMLFDIFSVKGEVVFVPFDRRSDAVARNLTSHWRPYLKAHMRVAFSGESPEHLKNDTLLIIMATSNIEEHILSDYIQRISSPFIWFGPKIADIHPELEKRSFGSFFLYPEFESMETEALYAAISFLFIHAWEIKNPEKGKIFKKQFQQSKRVVDHILNCPELKNKIDRSIRENRDYKTAFMIGPSCGTGLSWMSIFDRAGVLSLQWHPFGESAHGPIATVDDRVLHKYVQIEPYRDMIQKYPEDRIHKWQKKYMNNQKPEDYLKRLNAGEGPGEEAETAFFAQGSWNLPVLKTDYDTTSDNLIFINLADKRHLDQALDDLSIFGCRYARMIVISQQAYSPESKRSINQYPISHLVEIPALIDERTTEKIKISHFFQPFIMSLIGIAFSAALLEKSEDPKTLLTNKSDQ